MKKYLLLLVMNSLILTMENKEEELSKKETIELLAALYQLPPELTNHVLSQLNYFLIPSTNSLGTVRTIPGNANNWYEFLREQKRFCREKHNGS